VPLLIKAARSVRASGVHLLGNQMLLATSDGIDRRGLLLGVFFLRVILLRRRKLQDPASIANIEAHASFLRTTF